MMEKSIQFEIIFNENRERESQKFFFQYRWKKYFLPLKILGACALFFLLIGFLPIKIFDKSIIPYTFKFLGFLGIGYICLLSVLYFKSKKQTYQLIEKRIDELKQQNEKRSLIILNEESITIQKPTNITGSNWDKIRYKIVGDYLILNLLQNKINIIFTSSAFEGSDYYTFRDFVQKYSKQRD
ncbi:hypothetical protein [Chryseobacterium viscerum]|uniref:YcxB-like protein domain-containing protein n=1 Tax=Chryseobacterium viscerum TaxID=1037377 RepID=A0A5N4BK00_9FLAO|nr:hypothetical protein [Chryseobacterium viscerum]KAB1228435.1 hypothetical protein F8D52_22870 [Chryseobacterium viscerum]